jgi:hypothetical protein
MQGTEKRMDSPLLAVYGRGSIECVVQTRSMPEINAALGVRNERETVEAYGFL